MRRPEAVVEKKGWGCLEFRGLLFRFKMFFFLVSSSHCCWRQNFFLGKGSRYGLSWLAHRYAPGPDHGRPAVVSRQGADARGGSGGCWDADCWHGSRRQFLCLRDRLTFFSICLLCLVISGVSPFFLFPPLPASVPSPLAVPLSLACLSDLPFPSSSSNVAFIFPWQQLKPWK